MLNYRQLYYFWAVAHYGGITRAAERLHLTPQTISGQLNEFEQRYGLRLFERSGRRLRLSAIGEQALACAEEIFNVGQELEALLSGEARPQEVILRVGVADVVPKTVAYRLLSPTHRLDADARLNCQENKLDKLFAALALHQLDLVIADKILPTNVGLKGFSHLLGSSSLAFFATPPLANRYRDNFPQSLNAAPLLMPGSDSALRQQLERWLSQHNLQPRIKGEFDDSALLKAFGQQGVGIFPAPTVIARELEREVGVAMIAEVESVKLNYYAITAERQLRHPAVLAICEAAHRDLFNVNPPASSEAE